MLSCSFHSPPLSFNFGHLLFQTYWNVFILLKQNPQVNINTLGLLALLLVIGIGIFSNYFENIGLCIPLKERRSGTETRCHLTCPPWNVLDVPHLTGSARSHGFFFWCHWPVSNTHTSGKMKVCTILGFSKNKQPAKMQSKSTVFWGSLPPPPPPPPAPSLTLQPWCLVPLSTLCWREPRGHARASRRLGPELGGGGGDRGDLAARLTQDLLPLQAASQVLGLRPYSVPFQCHPAIPGPLPWAVSEGPLGGGPSGRSQ